mmetsp:Transcript_13071/g.46499  ORF Transcript_13071/g.46499 Transcript_13071/m.46499 type:complete len:84 (-) Transcript_13071:1482-1733(-)
MCAPGNGCGIKGGEAAGDWIRACGVAAREGGFDDVCLEHGVLQASLSESMDLARGRDKDAGTSEVVEAEQSPRGWFLQRSACF